MENADNTDELLLRLQGGDDTALDELYDKLSVLIYRVCYSYLKNRDDSEDALSDVFYLIAKNIASFKGKKGFNWIYTIAKNTSLNMLKKKKREEVIDPSDEETVNKYSLSEEKTESHEETILAVAREVLRPEEVNIIILHVLEDYKFKDIAAAVGSLESTVRWQYNNAIRKLRPVLEERGIGA